MLARRFLFVFALILSSTLQSMAQQWVEVHSTNFTVVTDTNQGRDVALRFEQMRAVFGAIFHRTNVNIPVPLTIIAFRNNGELKANGPMYNGKPIDVAGFYQMGEDRNHIALDLSAQDKWSVVFHEYAHMLLNSNYPRTQPWFDEGFAEYYAATHIGGKDVELGQSPPSAVELANTATLIPVVQLFSVQHESKLYNQSGHARQLFYAQSWLVVHWIFDTHRMGDLGKYFNLVMNRKVAVADAIKQAFGMEPADFDKEIYNYWRTARGQVTRIPVPSVSDPGGYTSNKLNDLQAKAFLAELHAHMIDRQKQAIEEFNQVLAAEPDNEVAQRGLGFAYLREHNLDAAAEHIRRAAALNDNDARVHYFNAVLLNRGSQENVEMQSRATQMSFELQKAIQIDPTFAEAYNMLAFTQLSMQKPDEALKSAKKAVELSPRNEQYMYNMAQIEATLGNTESAQAILRILQNSQDPAMAEQALHGLSMVSQVSKQQKQWAEQGLINGDPTDPRWKPKEGQPVEHAEVKEKVNDKPDMRKIQFLKGTLVGVECPAGPGATVTLESGGKKWRMKTSDRDKLVLIGTEQFSCDWKDVKVAVNYKLAGTLEGDLVSLELQ